MRLILAGEVGVEIEVEVECTEVQVEGGILRVSIEVWN